MGQNYAFISFPDELTTGSSIMPHKKNPDVFELVRAKGNKLQSLPNEISLITNNLPLGYHRDLQLIKESFLPAFDELIQCLQVSRLMLSEIRINSNIIDESKYDYMFSVEDVNKHVLNGIPFRDAYRKTGKAINNETFSPDKNPVHTHEGSIGNLCNNEIAGKMDKILSNFEFKKAFDAEKKLVGRY